MKVTLKKGFTHLGRELKAGDEFTGDSAEIDAIIRQGYADESSKQEDDGGKQGQPQSGQQQGQSQSGHHQGGHE